MAAVAQYIFAEDAPFYYVLDAVATLVIPEPASGVIAIIAIVLTAGLRRGRAAELEFGEGTGGRHWARGEVREEAAKHRIQSTAYIVLYVIPSAAITPHIAAPHQKGRKIKTTPHLTSPHRGERNIG